MKKYVSILLAAVLCSSLLAGCGGSGKSVQQPSGKTQVQAAQPEEAGPEEDAAQRKRLALPGNRQKFTRKTASVIMKG